MNDGVPMLDVRTKYPEEQTPLKDEELILASPILYGFSLSDKVWRTFSMCHWLSFLRTYP